MKKSNEDRFQRFHDMKIIPLIDLLNSNNRNLYTVDCINWLVKYCNNILYENEKNELFKIFRFVFPSLIFPIILLF
ncbi:MAG: hypothetical protein FWG49_03815, partial [Leptospirales bacterium]|nr:hypothetical protein [Leptospirales bacterium]